jgi:glycine betaine/proline transport system substrate-binding protein
MKKQASSWLALLAAFALFAAACGDDEAAPAAPDTSAADAAAADAEAAAAAAQADAAAAEAKAAAAAAEAEAASTKAAETEAALEAAMAEAVDPEVIAELQAQLQEAQADAAAAKADAEAAAEAAEAAEALAAAAAEEPMEEMSMTPGEGVSVIQARANWSTGYMQAAIYHNLLEELGYDVSEPADIELAPSNAYLAMAQGEYDFWVNSWFPIHYSFTGAEMPDGSLVSDHVSVVGDEMVSGGLQGFLTNKSLVDEHGITTLDQIVADPDLVAIYDEGDSTPGDGVIQILGCPEGWGCRVTIEETIQIAGWDNVEQVEIGAYDAVIGEAYARSQDGKPYIVYTWAPSAYVANLIPGVDAMWLSQEESSIHDGSITPTLNQQGPPAALGDSCTNDPCLLTFVAADIRVTAGNDFLEANPAAAKLFELVIISPVDVALENVAYDGGENTTEDVHRHAAGWIADNRDAVDEWLAAARAAA